MSEQRAALRCEIENIRQALRRVFDLVSQGVRSFRRCFCSCGTTVLTLICRFAEIDGEKSDKPENSW
jgi:hypothetical protein